MKKYLMITLLVSLLLTALMPASALGSSPASSRLMLYSSLPTAQLDLMVDMFTKKYPGIKVDVFSAGSADVFARAQAESGAAGGLVLGGSLESFRSAQDLFTAYTSKNAKNFHADYSDGTFTPIQLHVSVLVVNRDAARQMGVKVMGWESLKDDKLSGRVVYMNPAASSPVSEQSAFVTNFAKVINVVSPSAPSFALNAVTAGQYAVGIVNEEKAIERKLAGAKVDVVYATEGAAMGASYAGILKGEQNLENAKLFLDFITGREYQQAAADQLHQRSVRRDVDFGLQGIALTKNLKALDFESMALLTSLQAAGK